MGTGVTLSSAVVTYPSDSTPSNPSVGDTIKVRDATTNAPIEYYWNGNQWVTTQLFLAGADSNNTSGLLGTVISSTLGYSQSIPSVGAASKIWIEKASILAYVTVTGSTSTTYFTVGTNTLHSAKADGTLLDTLLTKNFTTQNVTNNAYYYWELAIGQTLNARPDNWEISFTKSGLGIISMRINPVLQYRIIKP